ncbi:hypothetical protein Q4603_21630 [Zobellia galactanivorans]|uniref:hypothetical protein n=1 Tax=Zobellia galactanivorans (strain DSM 12802 / CCUG 47099 / CIP 106680 / NCIMB 13871 / Dsij) TaxID=63186 RepID=UPI0026E43F09|nr:hypothetical protein [Zobellia galactanivorans]MDO6811233.1 hypothetical protein [Zobellia galactanivorans]
MKTIAIASMFCMLIACGQNDKKNINIQLTPYDSLLLSKLEENSKHKKIKYSIVVTSKLPYRLEINDIFAGEHIVPGPRRELNSNTHYRLDNYILGNGTYKAKFYFYPHEDPRKSGDGLIRQKDLDALDVIIMRYEEYNGIKENISLYKQLTFTTTEAVPFLEQEIEFTIEDLPYKIKGWSQSQDLRKMDPKKLEEEVVAYYKYLRDLMNNGKNDVFIYKEQKTKYLEAATMLYFNREEYENMLRNNASRGQNKINNMYPIENYRISIEAQGRLVKLYRTDKKYLNQDVLIYKDDKYIHNIAVRLHKPIGSETFEIITK